MNVRKSRARLSCQRSLRITFLLRYLNVSMRLSSLAVGAERSAWISSRCLRSSFSLADCVDSRLRMSSLLLRGFFRGFGGSSSFGGGGAGGDGLFASLAAASGAVLSSASSSSSFFSVGFSSFFAMRGISENQTSKEYLK